VPLLWKLDAPESKIRPFWGWVNGILPLLQGVVHHLIFSGRKFLARIFTLSFEVGKGREALGLFR